MAEAGAMTKLIGPIATALTNQSSPMGSEKGPRSRLFGILATLVRCVWRQATPVA